MHQICFKTLIFHIKNLNKYPTQNRVHIRKKQKKNDHIITKSINT